MQPDWLVCSVRPVGCRSQETDVTFSKRHARNVPNPGRIRMNDSNRIEFICSEFRTNSKIPLASRRRWRILDRRFGRGLKILMVPVRALKTYSILLAHPLTLVREGLAAL